MDQIKTAISSVLKPIQALYNKAFNANKYLAGIGLSAIITSFLFFIMVVLISLGDSGMKEDNSIKLADVVMPERQIDTFMTEVDKPEKPEEQPEDIAQPELDLQPLTGIDVSIAKPKANFKAGGSFFRDGEYIPLFKVQPIYPRRAQERGTEGYAIVSFTITETGSVEDAKSIEGWCGNVRNPYTQYQPCNIFNIAALKAAKNFKYEPAKKDGKNIRVKNVLHRLTFIMADALTFRHRTSGAYNNVLKAIEKRDFEEAIGIAESNLEYDYIFMNQIANAKYQQGNYLEARNWSNKFKDELLNEQREMPEGIIVRIFMVLISSLFNLGEYEELIKLEPEFNDYIKERKKYNELLAMTNFYFGVSYINTGNINKGAYYLGFAAKNSQSKDQLDYINSVIDQISSYL